MVHRKNVHPGNVSTCRQFRDNKCTRTENNCWFHHSQSTDEYYKTLVFQKAMEGTIPPDSEPKMRDLVKLILEKLAELEVRTKSLIQ